MGGRAKRDELTGLLGRSGLRARLVAAAASEGAVAVMFVGLDRFRLVNDTWGYVVGDRLLAEFARRLRKTVGARAQLGRLGGDEFIVAAVGASRDEAEGLAREVVEIGRQEVTVGPHALVMTASVGIVRVEGRVDVDRLFREAGAALNQAKDAGRDRIAWFDAQRHALVADRLSIEQDLRGAVARRELGVCFQPAFDLRHGRARGVEVLSRWAHPRRGVVPPSTFIPIAEQSDLIVDVGDQVVLQAIARAAVWASVPDLRVWVNVSARQLAAPGFANLVASRLDAAGVSGDRLGIEVTESMLAVGGCVDAELSAVRSLGVGIAIDDFGTGYSSLARLARMPVDLVKIDRSFVSNINTESGAAMVRGIVTLGHSMGAQVTAEGVETAEQLAAVIASGCDTACGYYMARPGPAAGVRLGVDLRQLSGLEGPMGRS